MRRFILFSFILFSIIISFGNISLANENMNNEILNESQLESIFPDYNFRNIIKDKLNRNSITMNDIKLLDGELDATSEKISDLTGISKLENIDRFIFWNNNIKEIPSEILQLRNLEYINLANNYITDNSTIELMKNKGIEVNTDLNFVENAENQYILEPKFRSLTINKDETVDLRNLIEKSIKDYDKDYQIIKQIPKDLNLNTTVEDNKVVSEDKMIIRGKEKGKTNISVYIQNKNKPGQSVSFKINVE